MIIIVFGLPGSGKSFFASRLAEKLEAKYVNSDKLRLNLFPVRSYSEEEKNQVYESMIREMEIAIRKGESLVLDATFYREDIRNKFIEKAKGHRQTIRFIEVHAEEGIIKERLGKKREYSEADFSIYQKVKASFEPLEQDHLTLQSTQENIEEMLEKALNHIQESNGN
ncbi:AAA family ATPase [Ekhidna sp.]|uniref:AAA family ATPase n=1 Tax=Ekhidna sp. TaxID=2608089 RepID=UPI003B5BA9D1